MEIKKGSEKIIGVQKFTPKPRERYFLGSDNSGHWYVVPVSKTDEWDMWNNLDEDDEAAWEAPEWAKRVGGSPTLVTFELYTIA